MHRLHLRPIAFAVTSAFAILVVLSVDSQPSIAGKYNSVLNIGDKAPTWKDLPGTDGKTHSSDQLENAKATVVVFTCNSCPYALDAEDRIIEFTKQYTPKGVSVVAINVNKVEEDLLPAMTERAKEKSYPFTYLFDESQQVAKDFGAKYTPEFFVLDADYKLVYMGAFDDSPDGDAVNEHYVRDAVDGILQAKKIDVTETVPIGCRIRLERERRRRR
ncbi:thioredoxin family protein [Rhodopirellula sp. MGV]|uniref:thioredoxin family protein n=1 Tax=Rhodopirellula sp. MGV TaxID=2023130 RepID=UPI000B969805|nr:thioredoxin family protein [Rhodopirellula sp. MGV]OYP33783.1 thioredoxin family protein [Rhodopirellula sp. MGV]PNY37551.1 thioredoxin family protein [Rhodopirellula baltica]